jgi:CPA1 family monovalent cation:H+ antiporter
MNTFETIILLMTLAIVLVGIALRLRIPYPLALVLGGAALGFTPGLNEIPFSPNLVLVIVLPPTLYYAAYSIPFKEFRRNIQDILWLALGLVMVTTLFIGLLFKWLFPELPWALAFTFGAIISPPDAVAATAILRRFTISSRLLTVLEGESLINDATGLVLYRISVIALLSGIFSLTEASLEFTKVAVGGILIGMMTGYLLHAFSSRFLDPILAVVFSFTIPYLTYILADLLQVSGVLAVVINGLIGSRMMVTKFAALTRVIGWAAWDILIILLNCFIFILIGLQLPGVIHRLTMEKILIYFGYGVILTVATILIRFVWVYLRQGII